MDLNKLVALSDIVARNLDDIPAHSTTVACRSDHSPVITMRATQAEWMNLTDCLHLRVYAIGDPASDVVTLEIELA